jgi:hypothetical protein
MDVRPAASIGQPLEGAMSECDFKAVSLEQCRPKLGQPKREVA